MSRFAHPTLSEYRARPARPERTEGGRRTHGAAPEPSVSCDLPRVTVVTAVKNGERHLGAAIQSVLDQSYPNLELIIVDAGSSDRTLDILRGYGDQIDYWVSERDRGMFDGMNRGLALASGELIKIHGADDLMPVDSVALAVVAYGRHAPGSNLVVRGDMDILDEDGYQLQRIGLQRQFHFMPAILHPTWYVPLRVYERCGLYDPSMVVSSDYEMFFYLKACGVSFVHAEGVLCQFRKGGTSTRSAVGFNDTFRINQRYLGLPIATYLAAVTGCRVAARRALEKLIGSRMLAQAKRTLDKTFAE